MAEPPIVGPPLPPPSDTWLSRAVTEVIEIFTSGTDVGKRFVQYIIDHRIQIEHILLNTGIDAISLLVGIVNDVVVSTTPAAAKLSADTINAISGTNIDADAIKADFMGAPSRASIVDIGDKFHAVIDKMFPIGSSTINNRDRADRQFALDNTNAYFGTNLNFQLRSLAIGTIASLFPQFKLQHLENLHQSINWAYGFGWLSWTVLSAVMGVTTTKPLTEYYNAQIKGNDFSEAEALHAYVQKRIDLTTLNKVLDNQGMRDDIRPIRIEQSRVGLTAEQAAKGFVEGWIDRAAFDKAMDEHSIRDEVRDTKINLARPELTEGDIQEGFDNGLFSEADVSDHYKKRGFIGFNLQAKIDLAKDHRMFALQKQLASTMYHAYVIGTVDQAEFTQYLSSIHWNQLEIDIELKRGEVDRRVRTEKHLTRAEIIRLASHGGLDPADALQRLVDMGLDNQDARMLLADAILEHAVSVIPSKVRNDCLTPQFEQNIITTALTVATTIDPTYVLRNHDFVSYVQCIISNYATQTGGGGTPPPPPVGPPAPQALVALPLTGGVRLSWQPVSGLVDYTVYRRDIGSALFIGISPPSQFLEYTDNTAVRGQTYVYVVRARANGVESMNSNEVIVSPV